MSGATTCANQVSLSEQPYQGFVCETATNSSATANSLRRTLSAVDMFSKIADDQDAERKNGLSQQQQKQQPGGQLDIWSSILIQKPSSLPPPYVHPLVKSKSCLSIKSLEICTENLGSESGSDGYPHSDISLSDTEEEEEAIEQAALVEQKKEAVIMKYSNKSLLPPSSVRRSFPPPLKSLSKPAGEGIQMKTHRKDGRLILEAVSVATSANCFNAQRQDGRLVLKFASPIPESKSESFDDKEDVLETDEEVEFECFHEDEIEQEEEPLIEKEEDKAIVLEMTSARVPKLPTGVINVHRSALMVNKFTGLTNNRNNITSCWSSSSNLKNKLEKMMNSPSIKLLPQSLPISPPTLAAAGAPRMSAARIIPEQQTAGAAAAIEPFFNRYEYCWRKDAKSSVVPVSGIHYLLDKQPNTKNTYHHHNNSNNLVRSKNNYYVKNNNDNLFGKDSTTTKGANYKEEKQNGHGEKVVDQHLIVFWEPPLCIATS
ncbi:hypothetical protein MKX03_027181 [Papaver bracteatum]|nr:hypothetical protein MKX03_027181 [Papaver bracteatum]